jgi:hypothetical protein
VGEDSPNPVTLNGPLARLQSFVELMRSILLHVSDKKFIGVEFCSDRTSNSGKVHFRTTEPKQGDRIGQTFKLSPFWAIL